MFGAAIIVFRESLEAALLIGIIAASTRGMLYRNRWVGIGIAGGMIGSLIVAWMTESIAGYFGGAGQEVFNASVLGIAVLMIGWHHIWMASHGREMALKAKGMGNAIRAGQQELSAIAIAIALTVLREGSEAALFLQGMLANTADGTGSVLLGGALGLSAGASIGAIAYFGLLRIPLSRFFSVTGTLLLLLAAGLAGQMAKFLIQADWLPALADPLWDTSGLISVQSWLGSALHMLLGYEDRPTGMQAVFYFTVLISISAGASWAHRNTHSSTHKLKSA